MIETATGMLSGAALLVLGRIAVAAIAAGLNLYATFLVLGIASLTGFAVLPAGLSGLENGVVLLTAAALLVSDLLADRERALAGTWNIVHALIKPAAATTICAAAVVASHWTIEALICAGAALLTVLAHAVRFGQRVAREAPRRPCGSAWMSAAEAALAVLLVLLAVRWPAAALYAAPVLLLALLVLAPRRWRAFQLAVVAQRARVRRLIGGSGWTGYEDLPGGIRRALPVAAPPAPPPRGARAAALHLDDVAPYRRGWIIATGPRVLFVTHGLRGVSMSGLPTRPARAGEPDALGTVLTLGDEGRLLLLPDGPGGPRLLRALEMADEARAQSAEGREPSPDTMQSRA